MAVGGGGLLRILRHHPGGGWRGDNGSGVTGKDGTNTLEAPPGGGGGWDKHPGGIPGGGGMGQTP